MLRRRFLSMVLLMGLLISQSVPLALAETSCDHAQFVSDLTVPDGSTFAPGSTFTKAWRLMNIGTCTWDSSYNLVWVGGDSLSAPLSVKLPVDVPPGEMVDISLNLAAPATGGHYRALFKLSNGSGAQFGIGDSGLDPFWADINVVQTSAVIYDFVASAPYAQWKSGAGNLPFPGTSGDSRGYAYVVNNPHLEDDSFDSAPGLLTVPQNKFNGYIQATYPEFQVQQGDHLQTLVNCEFGAKNCYVTFRIDYLLPNGVQKTFWSWKEAYDKRFYRADIDLSSLAGQRVRFVFMLLSTGFANGDRAIWGSPRIVRTGTTQPPAPPATLTPLPPLPPTPTPLGQPPPTVAPSGCDRAAFVSDVTVQDGTNFTPGAAFTKTWRLKNIGSCTWTTAYKLVYYSGDQLGASTAVNLPWNAAFDQTVDISVNMVAPTMPGHYRGFWILSNPNGQFFGIGPEALNAIWVDINVSGDAPTETGYNFFANACSAEWRSGAGLLPCPGTEGDSKGFVIPQNFTQLEDGTMGPAPSLLVAPENKYNGYIQGTFPTFTVQPGDHFKAGVGCESGYSCYVTFRLDYMTPNGGIFNFWSWREQNDKQNHSADVDLTPLAGKSVRFILTVLATGSASGDRVRWIGPTILRAPVPTPTPAPPTPVPSDWYTYTNQQYNFQFRYPPQAQIVSQTSNSLKMNLPYTVGTNLMEKYLETFVRENVSPCQSPLATSSMLATSETVVINGISFLKETGGDGGAGHLHEWVAYSTLKNTACISMDFVLHSVNPGVFSTPPTEFDKAAESAVFTQMMSTFAWSSPVVTVAPPTVPPVVVPSPNITSLFMIDSSNGWAIGNSYVLRTNNGGATWYNVTAPGAASVRSAFFLNASKGWFLSPDSIYRTTDGGLTWNRFSVPFNGGRIQFLNDTSGFVLSGEPTGMQKHPVSLYQTTDGGATWTLKYAVDPYQGNNTLPFSGSKSGMTFRDASTGWVSGNIPTPGFAYFYKTTNGGVSWAPQPLPIPAGYESADINAGSPRFFGANDAIMPVWMSTGVGVRNLFLYVTHDGGNTWIVSSAAAPNSFGSDVVSVRDGFSVNETGLLHVTNNSGASWRQITPNVSLGDGYIPQIDFVSTTTGWALRRDVNGNATLYRTNDGGATWTLLFGSPSAPPTFTPTPTSTPTPDSLAFTQSIVDALNARNFDLAKSRMDQSFAFAYWESQGISNTPDQAIESLRTRHLGATPLTSDRAKDLTGLLGGLNAYAIMGLDPAKSQALYVSGWGQDGRQEAILYATRRANGSLYWFGVLVAPYGFVQPTLTPVANNSVTDAAISYTMSGTSCSTGIQVDLKGTITTNGPAMVTYHWEITGDTVQQILPSATFPFSGAMSQNVGYVFNAPCGSHAVLLIVTSPNPKSAQVNILLYPPTATPITPTPATLIGPYAVVRVSSNDVLNIRSGAGISNPPVGSFAANAVDVMRTGPTATADGATWVEVQNPAGGTGWVNFSYLTEYVSPAAFCADGRVPALIEQLKGSMNQSNGSLFASLISPSHGLNLNYWPSSPTVQYSSATAQAAFTDPQARDWGSGGGSGAMDTGTFAQVVQPQMVDVLNSPYQLNCNALVYGQTYTNVTAYASSNMPYYSVVKPPTNVMDWKVWLIRIEYVNGQPYLSGAMHYVWEP